MLLPLLIIVYAGAVRGQETAQCTTGFTAYGDSCYIAIPANNRDFAFSLMYCSLFNASLVRITSSAQQSYLNNAYGAYYYWVATKSDDIWRYADDTPLEYENWNPSQDYSSQLCAMAEKGTGRWNVVSCLAKTSDHAIICEIYMKTCSRHVDCPQAYMCNNGLCTVVTKLKDCSSQGTCTPPAVCEMNKCVISDATTTITPEPSATPTIPPQACASHKDCTVYELCSSGVCTETATLQGCSSRNPCNPPEVCEMGKCVTDVSNTADTLQPSATHTAAIGACTSHKDCTVKELCSSGVCTETASLQGCSNVQPCGIGTCQYNFCVFTTETPTTDNADMSSATSEETTTAAEDTVPTTAAAEETTTAAEDTVPTTAAAEETTTAAEDTVPTTAAAEETTTAAEDTVPTTAAAEETTTVAEETVATTTAVEETTPAPLSGVCQSAQQILDDGGEPYCTELCLALDLVCEGNVQCNVSVRNGLSDMTDLIADKISKFTSDNATVAERIVGVSAAINDFLDKYKSLETVQKGTRTAQVGEWGTVQTLLYCDCEVGCTAAMEVRGSGETELLYTIKNCASCSFAERILIGTWVDNIAAEYAGKSLVLRMYNTAISLSGLRSFSEGPNATAAAKVLDLMVNNWGTVDKFITCILG